MDEEEHEVYGGEIPVEDADADVEMTAADGDAAAKVTYIVHGCCI